MHEASAPVPILWESIPASDRTSSRTDSSEAIDVIEEWMEICDNEEDHPDCREEDLPELPTRVLDVQDGVRLVEGQGQRDLYMCLNHCWGSSQIITTTQATLKDRQRGIAMEDLSNTFRDAVLLTRRLDIPYIWIDSLCIIQDDRRDWEIESAKMSSIYSHSFLTIAATHSRDGRGGLYTDTPDFKVSGTTPAGEEYCLFFRERIDHHLEVTTAPDRSTDERGYIGYGTAARHPLLTRAWVYQERLLSPRIVHFGPYEVFYECLTDTRCECGGITNNGSSDVNPASLGKLMYAEALYSWAEGEEWHVYAAYYMARVWRTMVCSYTALGITKPSDRLPAIGGLAKKMATSRKQTYVAGLWANSLSDDLIWTIAQSEGEKKPRQHPLAAPTWSWASVGTHVWYWDPILSWDPEEDITEDERPPYQHFARVECWDVEPDGVDEFGPLKRGTVTITGLAAVGTIERDVNLDDRLGAMSYYVRFSPTLRLKMQADYQLDHEGPYQVLPGTMVLCIRMSLVQEGRTEYLVSLVLKATGDGTHFERIGSLLVQSRPPPADPLGGIYGEGIEQSVTIR
ncbi:hypothetical protein FDECE_5028 [Fusarium decemcellulare]|nr:hypothetical protein FDECE_5028 [Fusarium decemcellulare]